MVLSMITLQSPLGSLVAVADDVSLHLLQFADNTSLPILLKRLQHTMHCSIKDGKNELLTQLDKELKAYFFGNLQTFTVPLQFFGTAFQQEVWHLLRTIPCGTTWSYAQLAQALGRPTAYRAVAQANGYNQHVIIVPCHRVINSNGQLGGYSAGLHRKTWLLEHENAELVD